MHHLRDSIRHLLAAVLMLGTLAGTVWTFSAGKLTLSGAWERIVSVGGIAAALELGVIFTAWYLGQLDQRIKAARRKEFIQALSAQRADLTRWFYGTAGISAVANLLFRLQQLHSLPLAAFVSGAPIVLVVLLLIKLRPLPDDYQDIGARATARALIHVVEESERTITRGLRRMGKGKGMSDEQMRQFAMATRLVGTYARVEEARALDGALQLTAPVVESTAEKWLRVPDLRRLYGISTRQAQNYIQRVPGRRRVANSNAWEAPESSVLATCGQPRSAREEQQEPVFIRQPGAVKMHRPGTDPQHNVTWAAAQSSEDEREIRTVEPAPVLPFASSQDTMLGRAHN